MKMIGTKLIETERLILKPQSLEEQKRLWEILVSKYVPSDEKLLINGELPKVYSYYYSGPKIDIENWESQEKFYKKKYSKEIGNDVFQWTIYKKEDDKIIGQISVQENHNEEKNPNNDLSIRDIGWYIDPIEFGKGYATEAARAVLDYMFNEVEITAIKTGAAILNKGSWRIMEKLGFIRNLNGDHEYQYPFVPYPVMCCSYDITKEQYLEKNKQKIK